jgi:hypothetical protein
MCLHNLQVIFFGVHNEISAALATGMIFRSESYAV